MGEGDGCPWPVDMESRRIAALKQFRQSNPNYRFTLEELQELSRDGILDEKTCVPLAVRPPGPLAAGNKKKAGRPRAWVENRWCLATTLELLAEMKAFVRANRLHCLGECMVKWQAIASRLSNPLRLAPARLARSSMVRFDNLRRTYRTSQRSRIESELQESLIEYFQICELQKPPGSKWPMSSTLELALDIAKASPSPPPTPAKEKHCRRRTPIDSGSELKLLCGGDADDEQLSDPMSYADVLSPGRDDDTFVFSPMYDGDPHQTLEFVATPIRMVHPADNCISSDEEEADRSSGPVSPVARSRSRRTSLPGAYTSPSPVMRGRPSRASKCLVRSTSRHSQSVA